MNYTLSHPESELRAGMQRDYIPEAVPGAVMPFEKILSTLPLCFQFSAARATVCACMAVVMKLYMGI